MSVYFIVLNFQRNSVFGNKQVFDEELQFQAQNTATFPFIRGLYLLVSHHAY